MPLSYHAASLGTGSNPSPALVRDLQTDLRALGYLRRGIDGRFGDGTQRAIRHLQYDLLHNDGRSTAADGDAPVAMTAFNRGVTQPTGIVDTALAESIEALLADPRVPRLPSSATAAAANRAALARIATTASAVAPAPFLLAIFTQESGGQHFAQPQSAADSDDVITVGLDTNGPDKDAVTSRGYGLGQYTLFHHPPRAEEIADVMLDPLRNTQRAFATLRDKFDRFVAGHGADQAEERAVEHPLLALRPCRYGPQDARYLSACLDCAHAARKLDIAPATPLFHGSPQSYGQAQYYTNPHYVGVPDRAAFPCDWPYAVRRYNGSGPDSFNYQARVLANLLAGPTAAGGAA